jgi:hypothetical protein
MNKFYFSFLVLLIISLTSPCPAQIYVSTGGDDNNPGTYELPLKTIPAAVNKAQAGDTIYLRGGIYTLTTTISISKNGSQDSRYYLFAYTGERPLLDFSSMAVGSSNRGISLSGSYWHIKGIDIKGAGDNGMHVRGANNIIEFCSFYENRDTGLQLGNGASDNRIINCDSYFNADPDNEDADGFAPKLDVGTGNYFYGCRAWQNSDDGYDGYMRGNDDVSTTLENCWVFNNGYLKNGSASAGNGNGFKMGGSDDRNLMHNVTLKNCIAFDNRVKGFDQNNNKGSMTLYNCTAYRNGTNYSIPFPLNTGKTATIINSVALGIYGPLGSFVVQQTNSWLGSFNVTNEDFISIDTSGVRGERKADGSLPDVNFMHLASGSDLIDAGTDVGLPYYDNAPDLGAFESGIAVPVELISFSASVSGNLILLKWMTATELNNYGFEIQKKYDNTVFRTIGFVTGAGTTSETKEYQFADKNILEGINNYRLKQVDFDGSFSYSDELLVNYNIPNEFSLSQNYPNPFNPTTNLEFQIPTSGLVSLKVFDVLGNEVATLVDEEKPAGRYTLEFSAKGGSASGRNGSGLTSGIYLYQLRAGDHIITRKMILLK